MQTPPNHSEVDANPLGEYVHYSEVPLHYPDLITPNRIQWMIRHRHVNGLNKHVLKVGNALFVHLPSFAHWLDGQRGHTE